MRIVLSILLAGIAGVVGLALVFTDMVPLPLGLVRVVAGGLFYALVGFVLGRWHAGRRPVAWGVAAAWGLILLGAKGTWVSLTDPASGDLPLALLFLVGAPSAAAGGAWLGSANGRS